jgi:DNA-directed RNA polymerase specialized sigma24 family protein
MFYYEDLPETQIAEVLDCSVGTVKSQLSKARAKLQKWLGTKLEVTG